MGSLRGRTFYLPNEQEYKKHHKGTLTRNVIKVGRNDICPCQATEEGFPKGVQLKKYKNCCLGKKLFVKEKL